LAVAEGPLVDHVRTILRMPPILLTGWTSSPAASAISLSPCIGSKSILNLKRIEPCARGSSTWAASRLEMVFRTLFAVTE